MGELLPETYTPAIHAVFFHMDTPDPPATAPSLIPHLPSQLTLGPVGLGKDGILAVPFPHSESFNSVLPAGCLAYATSQLCVLVRG